MLTVALREVYVPFLHSLTDGSHIETFLQEGFINFIAYLKTEPLLKAILAGHEHVMVQDRFSPTAEEFVVGGNFMFAAREVLVV